MYLFKVHHQVSLTSVEEKPDDELQEETVSSYATEYRNDGILSYTFLTSNYVLTPLILLKSIQPICLWELESMKS